MHLPPERQRAVYAAFEQCWTLLGPALSGQPQDRIDATVEVLAIALMDAACAGHTDPADLQQEVTKALLKSDLDVPSLTRH